MKRVMITGWAGFIGSNLCRMILKEMPEWEIHGVDSHTYAARPDWVTSMVLGLRPKDRLRFIDYPKLDLFHRDLVAAAMDVIKPDIIIHLAAESHVCRSVEGPRAFLRANVVGTFNLLEAARESGFKGIFHHVSTDEVYGEAEIGDPFHEGGPYKPRSPYAASKAASDHFVQAYHHTYGLDTRMTNCSNNFGPNQHEEKLIPKTILALLNEKPVTLYGSGSQVRDWIWVEDHCRGILAAIENGEPGGRYLLGGDLQKTNREIVEAVAQAAKEVLEAESLPYSIEYTNDRPSDDQRYAIDCSLAKATLAWSPAPGLFHRRLVEAVSWYAERMK